MSEKPNPAAPIDLHALPPGDYVVHATIDLNAPPPDWLTAQAKAIGTARPKKPRSAYARRWR
jgi:hypothetical protein